MYPYCLFLITVLRRTLQLVFAPTNSEYKLKTFSKSIVIFRVEKLVTPFGIVTKKKRKAEDQCIGCILKYFCQLEIKKEKDGKRESRIGNGIKEKKGGKRFWVVRVGGREGRGNGRKGEGRGRGRKRAAGKICSNAVKLDNEAC